MLNDDEIVTSTQEESDPVEDEMDEDEDNNNNHLSIERFSVYQLFYMTEAAWRFELSHKNCNVATPNSGRYLWWTRHPHVHIAAAAQLLFDPRGIEPRRPEDERERCFELTRER
ncbi:hypothetical protein TNCV_3210611 [Trichonephila clavipes]|nr:hypothetical protein TNCV_3210611 [Trichonephila clavipes]